MWVSEENRHKEGTTSSDVRQRYGTGLEKRLGSREAWPVRLAS